MNTPTIVLVLFACVGLARAQTSIEPEKLQKIAGRLMERASDQENLPLKMEVDPAKAAGMTIKDYGCVVLAAKNLSADTLSKAGNEPQAVGFLWLKDLVPVAEGKPLAEEKRRTVKVTMEQNEYALQLLTLGLRKNAEGAVELAVFGKGKDAVLTLPLKAEQHEQQLPVELDMRQGTESLGLIDIRVLGKLHAALPVGEP